MCLHSKFGKNRAFQTNDFSLSLSLFIMLRIGNQEARFFLIVLISNLLFIRSQAFLFFLVWKIPKENTAMDFLHSGTLSALLISAAQASPFPEHDGHPGGFGGGGGCCRFHCTELSSRISQGKSKITVPSRRHSQEASQLQHAAVCSREASSRRLLGGGGGVE